MIKLPKKIIKAQDTDPRKLVIIANTKVGKTTAVAQIPNCLLVDLEGGSKFTDAMKIDIKEIATEEQVSKIQALRMAIDEIKAANLEAGEPIYDYIALDTASALEGLAEEYALIMYTNSPQGKTFAGKSVLELDHGGGYDWLRRAFMRLYAAFEDLPKKGIILLGHTKTASINKDGKELGARDIQLTGKLKTIICADADAIGFMFRDQAKEVNNITFKTNEQDLVTGARPEHLKQKEFVISELDKEGNLKTYWDKIFQTLNDK